MNSIWCNDQDLVLADSPAQASRILQAICGCDGDAGHAHDDGQLWERMDDGRMVRLHGIEAPASAWTKAGTNGPLGRLASAGGAAEVGQRSKPFQKVA